MGTINEAREILEIHKTSMFDRLKSMHAFLFAENIKEASRVRLRAEIVTKDRLKKAQNIFNEFSSEVTESDHHTIKAIQTMLDLIINMDNSAKLRKAEGIDAIEEKDKYDWLDFNIHDPAIFKQANNICFPDSTVALKKEDPSQPINYPSPILELSDMPLEPKQFDLPNANILKAMTAARSSCKTLVGFGAGNDKKRKDTVLLNLNSDYVNAKTESDRNKALVNFLLATIDVRKTLFGIMQAAEGETRSSGVFYAALDDDGKWLINKALGKEDNAIATDVASFRKQVLAFRDDLVANQVLTEPRP